MHDELMINFGCARESQKVRSIGQFDKVSLTINLPYACWREIRGLLLDGLAHVVSDPTETRHVFESMTMKFPRIQDYAIDRERQLVAPVRIEPEIITLLDYRKGFGHTETIRI